MPSKIEHICAELEEHMKERGVVHDKAPVLFGFGARELDRAARPPRVVWRLVRAEHEGTTRPGQNPRPLFNRRVELEAHLWGQTYEQAESLLEDVARALHDSAVGSYTPLREEWPAEDDDGRAHQSHGVYCKLTLDLLVPVTAVEQTTARVTATAFDTSTSAPDDGDLDVGEP